jgi:hypothetical protein
MATNRERKLAGSGGRFAAIGVPFVVIGVVLWLLLDGTARGIGAAIAVLGAIPVVVGFVLLLTAGADQAARKDKPYA